MKRTVPFLHHLLATIICVALFAYPSLAKAEQCGDLPVCGTGVKAETACTQNAPTCCIPKSLGVSQNFLCSCTPGACSAPMINGPFVTSPVCTNMWQCSAEEGDTVTLPSRTIEDPKSVIPDFNTPIPSFVAPEDGGLLLGSYIVAIYRYGLSIGIIAATVMFIWGGFVYLIGSSGAGSIAKGRSIMEDAVIGLILLFSANLILRTLNPSLTTLKTLNITAIQAEEIGATDFIIDAKTGYRTPIVGGSTGNDCLLSAYGMSDAEIGKRMVKISFLGDQWPMHQLVAPDFQSAFREIESADPNSPTGQWVAKMRRMAPYEGSCKQGKGYPDRGSRFGGSYVARLDKKIDANDVSKKPCLSCDLHAFGAAIDLDACFNPMCPSGMSCRLTDPKINRIPQDVVNIFAKYRIYWGGYGWTQTGKDWNVAVPRRDAMHFEWHGRCWNF